MVEAFVREKRSLFETFFLNSTVYLWDEPSCFVCVQRASARSHSTTERKHVIHGAPLSHKMKSTAFCLWDVAVPPQAMPETKTQERKN